MEPNTEYIFSQRRQYNVVLPSQNCNLFLVFGLIKNGIMMHMASTKGNHIALIALVSRGTPPDRD